MDARRTLPPADHPLTDAEVLERFGPLMSEYVECLRTDPMMLVELAEAAAGSMRKREANAERRSQQPTETRVSAPKARAGTLERDAEALRLKGLGLSAVAIAERLGVSRGSVVRILKRASLRAAVSDTP